jgi:hypothetical protein
MATIDKLKRAASTWSSRALLLVLLVEILQLANYKDFERPGDKHWPILGDALGYYVYLPATFLYQDYDWTFVPKDMAGSQDFVNAHSPETGRPINKYSPGVALLLLPFYLMGQLFATLLGFPVDGFSPPFRLMVSLAALCYQMAGLWILRKLLKPLFSDGTIALSLLGIALGTNLLYYTVHEGGMSHVYSFFLLACVMHFTLQWHQNGRLKDLAWLALTGGLMILVRPPNGLFLLFPLLYAPRGWREKIRFLRLRWPQLLLGAGIGMLCVFPQLLYWKLASGSWLFDAYKGEGFLWGEPALAEILWSYRKGWWVYTPLAVLALLGLFGVKKHLPGSTGPLLLYTLLNLYVVSCWWCWWYGGSFGMRALIEMFAPLSLGLAALWEERRRWKAGKVAALFLLALFVGFNLFQTYQYRRGYIHWENMNKQAYWAVFGKAEIKGTERARIEALGSPPPGERLQQYRAKND